MRNFGDWVLAIISIGAASFELMRPSPASASPLQDLVGDTNSPAGMQAGTLAGGSGAAYFNPALLTDAPQGLKIGFFVLNQNIGVSLDGRPGPQFSIPAGIETFAHADLSRFDNYPIATSYLELGRPKDARHAAFAARPRQADGSGHSTLTYDSVGLVVKMFEERIVLGFHGLVPNGEFTKMRAFFNDEREQYFSNSLQPELYSDRMTALSFALGLGVKLMEQLSLGIGATFALKAGVGAGAYVADTGNLGAIRLDIDSSVNIGIAPHFGLSWKPTSRLRVTATAHSPQRVELASKFKFLLSNAIEQEAGVVFVLDYTPWQLGVGAAYDLIQEQASTLTIAGTLKYAAWSAYVDRHGDRPSAAYAWADTLAPTLGVRYRFDWFSTSFDLLYSPTPVPAQTGRTNYVDSDRVAGSLGADCQFKLFGTQVHVGVQAQLHRLVPRYQRKLPTPTRADGRNAAPDLVKDELPDDAQKSGEPVAGAAGLQTNNPGWPGFASGGWITGGALYFSVAF